jgi:inorganic pyrophosphatase
MLTGVGLDAMPETPLVRIEVPRWGVVKPRADGSVDFLSPLPCPYNYGCIPGIASADGDPVDAVVLGPRLPRGREVRVRARAVMGFVDAGHDDPKVICSAAPLTALDRRGLEVFFAVYALAKRALNRLRGRGGPTCCTGWS